MGSLVFKTSGGSKGPRRVRFPSASAKRHQDRAGSARCHVRRPTTITSHADECSRVTDNGYKVMPGWRVGHLVEESTRSGLLVPVGMESESDALSLVDVTSGRHFWAVPTGAWRFIWPSDGRVVVAVRESQIIAEQGEDASPDDGTYL